jgi:hypothetical protein
MHIIFNITMNNNMDNKDVLYLHCSWNVSEFNYHRHQRHQYRRQHHTNTLILCR